MFSEIKIKQGSIDYKLILSHYPQLIYLNVEIYKYVNIYLNNTIFKGKVKSPSDQLSQTYI